MPATAGRVRMPANNRVHSSAALQTHGIWQSAIGYDPYAPNKEDKKDTSQMAANAEPDAENAYANFQGLLALAKISNSNVDVDRGACKKCGRVGHLKFQCKNLVKVKDDNEEKDAEAMQVPALIALDKVKGRAAKADRRTVESSDESDEDDSESSDSEVDSEIERIIAERSGKKISKIGGSSRKRKDSDEDESDSHSDKRKKRGRSKKRHGKREISDSDSDDSDLRRKRREHRRRDKSSDENYDRKHRRKSLKEKKRRRSRRSDSDSETSEDSARRHRRRIRKAESSADADLSDLDDSRMGRDVRKSEKSWRHRSEDDE